MMLLPMQVPISAGALSADSLAFDDDSDIYV